MSGDGLRLAVILPLVACWFVFLALAQPVNHDESQYVAAAVLSRDYLIFRDFLSLQPPLHAWLVAPVAWLSPGHTFTALRLANASMAVATLALVHAGARQLDVPRPAALATMLLMGSCWAFQYAGVVMRNDAAPVMLLAAAMLVALRAIRRGKPAAWMGTGLLLGLAASAKLSYGPHLAFAGLFLLVQAARGRMPWSALGGFAGLAAVGLTPMLAGFLAAPRAFLYGVLEFGATAPFDWYRINGLGESLTLVGKLGEFRDYAMAGPALLMLLFVAWDMVSRRRAGLADQWLAVMLAAGLVGAWLPTPTQLPYLLPLLPPLFVLGGRVLANPPVPSAGLRRGCWIMFALLGLAGLMKCSVPLLTQAPGGLTAPDVDREARWIGERLRARGLTGGIASLAPERLASSGYVIDRRFATGPFVFRGGGSIDPARARALGTVTPGGLGAAFDRDPPAAILAGYERGYGRFRLDPEAPLVAWARAHGYRPISLPGGKGTLYVRAAPKAGRNA